MKDRRQGIMLRKWMQGLRPGAYGDVWDAMSPAERLGAFAGDLVLGLGGAALLYLMLG